MNHKNLVRCLPAELGRRACHSAHEAPTAPTPQERLLALIDAATLACLRYAVGSVCPRCLGAIQFTPRGCGLCDGRGWVLRPWPGAVVYTEVLSCR